MYYITTEDNISFDIMDKTNMEDDPSLMKLVVAITTEYRYAIIIKRALIDMLEYEAEIEEQQKADEANYKAQQDTNTSIDDEEPEIMTRIEFLNNTELCDFYEYNYAQYVSEQY